jgi:hypothetical protein
LAGDGVVLEPIVGSANFWAISAAALWSASIVTPAWAVIVERDASTDSIAFIRVSERAMDGRSSGWLVSPERPASPPSDTTATPAAAHRRTVSATSDVFAGRTTTESLRTTASTAACRPSKKRYVEQITLMEGPEMDLHATFEVVAKDGSVDFRGPYVQGKRGDRFVYISWGLTPDPDDFGMFRRAKVILDEMPVDLLEAQAVMATIEGTSRRWRHSVRPRPPRTRCVVKGLISPREPFVHE